MARRKKRDYNSSDKDKKEEQSTSNRNNGGTKGKQQSTGSLAINALQAITAANLSYGYPAGTTLKDLADKKGMMYAAHSEIPGIGAYYITPHVGVSAGADSVINLAAKRLFTTFTFANGRNPDYQSADAIMSTLAVGQAACMYEYAVRAYRILNTFSQQNRFLPKALFEANLLDYNDFVMHMADFAAWIDQYRLNLQSLYVPNNLPILEEWRSCFRDIYVDEIDNPKSQIFMFVPRSFLIYNPAKYEQGGALIPVDYLQWEGTPAAPKLYKFAELKSFADALVGILMYDDNINMIMSDIALSYGPDSVDHVVSLNMGEPIEFKYDPVVNATVHNSSILAHTTYGKSKGHSANGSDSREIWQENNVIYHIPRWQGQKRFLVPHIEAKLFDSPTQMTNPILNLSMARMTMLVPKKKVENSHDSAHDDGAGYCFNGGSANGTIQPQSLGVWTIDDFIMYKAYGTTGEYSYTLCDGVIGSSVSIIYDGWEKFKDCPLLPMITTEAAATAITGPSDFQWNGSFGNVCYYTILEEIDLKKMHEVFMQAQLAAGLKG